MDTELLVRAARALVEKVEDKQIDMSSFGDFNFKAAPLAICFAGWCPYLNIEELKIMSEDYINETLSFSAYSFRVFDIPDHKTWEFIFGAYWPNSTKAVLKRVLQLQKHGIPDKKYLDFSYENEVWEPKPSYVGHYYPLTSKPLSHLKDKFSALLQRAKAYGGVPDGTNN